MRRTKTTWLGLFCLACFIVYLRLSRRRRQRRIAALELALGLRLDSEQSPGIGPGSWSSTLYELQGRVQEVFVRPTNHQQILSPVVMTPPPAAMTLPYGSFVAEDSWQNYLAVERRVRNPQKKRRGRVNYNRRLTPSASRAKVANSEPSSTR